MSATVYCQIESLNILISSLYQALRIQRKVRHCFFIGTLKTALNEGKVFILCLACCEAFFFDALELWSLWE